MAGVLKKSFESPDERRAPDKTEVQVVDLGSVKAARMTFSPVGGGRSASSRSLVRRVVSSITRAWLLREACTCVTTMGRSSRSAPAMHT